jgi:hypothetical protein
MFLCRAPPFNTLPVQLQNADQKSVQNEWFFFVDDAPELTKSVLAILSLPASEASVERSFSQQALVHRKHRNRMRAEQVETEMIIKYNLRPKINKIIKETATQDVETESAYIPLFEIRHQDIVEPEEDEVEFENSTQTDQIRTEDTLKNTSTSKGRKSTRPTPSDSELPATKKARARVADRTEMVVPYEAINNLKEFVSHYVSKNNIVTPSRWNESAISSLTMALDEWNTNHDPIKDTLGIVQKKINVFVKQLASQQQEEQKQEDKLEEIGEEEAGHPADPNQVV